jgi:putative phage-type endonuclease
VTREEWLEQRKGGIGGSDAAALVGLNQWATPYTVWADKTGRLPPKGDNEAMRQGRDLEQYVAARWMESTGKKCRRKTGILKNSDYPFALANIDRWVLGEKAGLECKTTSIMNLKKFKGGEFPENYYCQCVHYMAVTGAIRWYLAVLVLNQGFYTFVIDRDEDEINALMNAERDFWEYVKTDTPPPVDGLNPTTGAINAIYSKQHEEGEIEILGKINDINQYLAIKQQIKTLEIEKERIEQKLKEELKTHEKGYIGTYQITWKNQKRQTFQVKNFTKDFTEKYPDFSLEKYYKTTEFRKFEIKEIK